jgi:hypothetical protein
MHYRTKRLNTRNRMAILPPQVLIEKYDCFYESHELPNEFRERLAGFTRQFTAPEELTVARYLVDYLLEEERIPSARQVNRAIDVRLPIKRTGELVAYLVVQLRNMFAGDWQGVQRFGVSVALAGVRLRVEIWVISAFVREE